MKLRPMRSRSQTGLSKIRHSLNASRLPRFTSLIQHPYSSPSSVILIVCARRELGSWGHAGWHDRAMSGDLDVMLSSLSVSLSTAILGHRPAPITGYAPFGWDPIVVRGRVDSSGTVTWVHPRCP